MAASGSKKYDPLLNNEMDSEILKSESGFTFVDFIPKVIDSSGFFTTKYEKFQSLVERANVFLQRNPEWKIVTCETFEYQQNAEKNHSKMTYSNTGRFFRGLRLWLAERKDDKKEQQIGYLYLVPQQIKKSGFFAEVEFETLDTVIERFNSNQRFNPIPGRIISVESLNVKTKSWKEIDPDRTTWTKLQDQILYFVFVIKIFYEVTDCSPEEIGLADFIPPKIAEEGVFSLPKYERFTNVLNKASNWWSQQQNLRFCNASSLALKGKKADTQKMIYVLNTDKPFTCYVRVLRIAYAKPIHSTSEKQSPITMFTCRTFVPMQLTAGLFSAEYETIWTTKERIVAWVKATGVDVIGAETTSYPKRSNRNINEGPEATFMKISDQGDNPMVIVIRLYINGVFTEPPSQMLPPMPVIEENSCHIS